METRVVSTNQSASLSHRTTDSSVLAIQAAKETPRTHPSDAVLLRSLASITKPKVVDAGSSFLRRTEYIGNTGSKKGDAFGRVAATRRERRPDNLVAPLPATSNKEDPAYILKSVERSFEVAAANLSNPARIQHPTRRGAKLVSSHPILPDLNAMTDAGGYLCIKFQTNPVQPSNVYDIRLDAGLLKAATTEARRAAHERAEEAHTRDPANHPKPDPCEDYTYYLAEDIKTARGFKRKADVNDISAKDDDDLYTFTNSEGRKSFRYKSLRTYETMKLDFTGNLADAWNTEVAMAVNDGKDGRHQKAVYMYPIIHKSVIRPQRSKNIDAYRFGGGKEEENEMTPDMLHVAVYSSGQDVWRREYYAKDPLGETVDEEDEKRRAEAGGEEASGNGRMEVDHDDEREAEAESE